MVFAGLVSVAILWLDAHGASRRLSVQALGQLEASLYRQDALEWQAVVAPSTAARLAPALAASRRQSAEAFEALAASPTISAAATTLRAAVGRYSAAVDDELRLFATGDVAGGLATDVARVDPAFEEVADLLHRIEAAESLASERAERLEEMLAVATILITAAALFGACWVYAQAVRAAAQRASAEQIWQARARLEAALLVARTVAHELNNGLSPVLGFAELLGLHPAVAADPAATAYTAEIVAASQRATATIAQLQRLVRLEEEPSPMGPDLPILNLDRSTASAATHAATAPGRAQSIA